MRYGINKLVVALVAASLLLPTPLFAQDTGVIQNKAAAEADAKAKKKAGKEAKRRREGCQRGS